MPLSNEEFEKALAESQTLEPRVRIPFVERLAEMFPEISFEDLDATIRRCREIKLAAAVLADDVFAGRRKENPAYEEFASRYSDLSNEALNHAWKIARHGSQM